MAPLARDREDQFSTLQLQNVAAGHHRARSLHSLQVLEADALTLPTVSSIGGTVEEALGVAFPVAAGPGQKMGAEENGAVRGDRQVGFPSQHLQSPAPGPATASVSGAVQEGVLFRDASLPGRVEGHQQQFPVGQPGDAGLVVLGDADGNPLRNQLGFSYGLGIHHPDRVGRLEGPRATSSRRYCRCRDGCQDKTPKPNEGLPGEVLAAIGLSGRSRGHGNLHSGRAARGAGGVP